MKSPVREESPCVGNVHAHFEECEVASSIWNRMTLFRSRSCMAVHALFAVVASAYGADYYLKNNATDFSIAESYTTDADGTQLATRAPGQEDEVVVPAGTFAISGESASFETLSGVKRVRPNDGAVLEFTIADGDTRTFNAPINWNAEVCTFKDGNAEADLKCYGKIVKKGGGTLILASSGNTTAGNYNQDYFTQIDLQQGTLKLPQNTNKNMGFGDLTMAAGSTLVTCGDVNNTYDARSTYVRSFNGDGTVTNETTRSVGQIFSPYARNLVQDNVFRGRICHSVKLRLAGRLTQYGNSTGLAQSVVVEDNSNHLIDGYDRGYYSFENVALLGSATFFQYSGTGGAMHYFGGEDATIAQDAYLYTRQYPASFDAGWHGGLNITGNWRAEAEDVNAAVSKWVVLMGSNTVPCTISGDFIERTWSDKKDYASPDGIPYPIFVDKRGSGTWRFAAERNHSGGFAIKEGCLQFESIAEKGMASSLGNSTNLTTACSARDLSSHRVDYAFSLGSADASAAPAVFEFVGATSGVSSTRPLVLEGKGGAIRASGIDSARLGFGDVSALEAGETTLTIDGTNTLFNTISGIRDGKGKVNVIKAGNGDWYLSCSNTFSGDLVVNAGTLTVLGPKYTWFRFTVKQTGNSNYVIAFRQLALYDANGVRQNIGLSVAPPKANDADTMFWPDSDSAGLVPGSFAFGSKTFQVKLYNDINRWVDQLFGDVSSQTTFPDGSSYSGDRFRMRVYKMDDGSTQGIKKSDPNSWIPFVMRLANGAPEIVSYDILSYHNSAATNEWPKVATMEASIDGVNWDLVETNAFGEAVAEHNYDFSIPLGSSDGSKNNSNTWFSNGKGITGRTPSKGTTPRPGAGFPIRGRVANFEMPLQNVRSVSVAAGATLKTETEVLISSLKIDVDGAGTMDGFTFAQNGIINVLSGDVQIDDKTQTIELPGEYVNCTGLENIARWNVEVNGIRKPSFVPRVVDGCIQIKIRGLVVSIR